jgi:predicted PurR-regulated permease PerM
VASDTVTVLLVVLGTAAVLAMAWATRQVITWVLAAGFLAFSIDPLTQWLRQKARVGRGGAITLSMVVLGAVLVLLGLVLLPPVVDGARALLNEIPKYADQLKDTSFVQDANLDGAVDTAAEGTQDASKFFTGISKLVSVIGPLASGAFAGFMIFILTIYFLTYGRSMIDGVAGRLPPERGDRFAVTSRRIYQATKAYWYGKFVIAAIAGFTVWVPMELMNIPYATTLAFFVALTDLIPNIGSTIGAIPVIGVALFEAWWKALIMLVIVLVYQQIENSLITPKIFERAIDLHPFLSFVVVLVFGGLFGVIGALLAIPITAAIKIVLEERRRAAPSVQTPAAPG